MSTTYHTAIATGASVNSSTINNPLEELDAAIGQLNNVVPQPNTTTLTVTTSGAASGSEDVDVQTTYGLPSATNAVILAVAMRDSGSAAAAANAMWAQFFEKGETDSDKKSAGLCYLPSGVTNYTVIANTVVIPVDSDGYFTVEWASSGSGTLDLWVRVEGYITAG